MRAKYCNRCGSQAHQMLRARCHFDRLCGLETKTPWILRLRLTAAWMMAAWMTAAWTVSARVVAESIVLSIRSR